MSLADMEMADVLPGTDVEVEITLLVRELAVVARVEAAGPEGLVVRPGVSDFVGQDVVGIGDQLTVLWLTTEGARALPAEVGTVERGAAPRWHLRIVGDTETVQRRQAVRARVALPLTVTVNGIDLDGDVVDLSEGGARAAVDPYGIAPLPGTAVSLTVRLENGPVSGPAEVVRQQTVGGRWALSLRFTDLPDRDQDRLRRRVFQAIREERARHSD
jgi:hypothetical protein